MKKLRLLAIFILLASSVSAGWNTNAWPSDETFRGLSFTGTTFAAHQHTATFSVTSSISIPDYSSGGYLYGASSNWVLFPYSGGDVFFSEPSPLPRIGVPSGTASNNFVITNVYYTSLQQGTNAYSDAPAISGIPYTNQYEVVEGGITNTITEVYDETIVTNYQIADMLLDVKDVRYWDCYKAILERRRVILNNDDYVFESGALIGNSRLPLRYYRNERDNLNGIKKYIADFSFWSVWVDTNNFTSGDLDAWFEPLANNLTSNYVTFATFQDIDEILTQIGAPSNYFDNTPWRQLNGAGLGYGKVVTNTFIITGDAVPPALITNSVVTYHGDSIDVSGTNGQSVTALSTSSWVSVGFTELDYGWKYIDKFINQLQYYAIAFDNHITKSTEVEKFSNQQSTWALAQADVDNNTGLTGEPATRYATENFYGTFGVRLTNGNYIASRKSDVFDLNVNRTSSVPHTIQVYMAGDLNTAGFSASTYDANGYTLLTDGTSSLYNTYGPYTGAVTTVSNLIGNTNIANWVSAPVTNTWVQQGYTIHEDFFGDDYGGLVIYYDFEYKEE